jgi:hypothetical protein
MEQPPAQEGTPTAPDRAPTGAQSIPEDEEREREAQAEDPTSPERGTPEQTSER